MEDIEDRTLFLRHRPGGLRDDPRDGSYLVVLLQANTKLFSPDKLRVGALVEVFGHQTATRRLMLTNGASAVAPVIGASCMEPFNLERHYGR